MFEIETNFVLYLIGDTLANLDNIFSFTGVPTPTHNTRAFLMLFVCGTSFFFKGRFHKKNHVKSVVFCQTGGGGGHPEPNSIFEEKKVFFRDHIGPF